MSEQYALIAVGVAVIATALESYRSALFLLALGLILFWKSV